MELQLLKIEAGACCFSAIGLQPRECAVLSLLFFSRCREGDVLACFATPVCYLSMFMAEGWLPIVAASFSLPVRVFD